MPRHVAVCVFFVFFPRRNYACHNHIIKCIIVHHSAYTPPHPPCIGLYSSDVWRFDEGWSYSMCMYNNMYYFTPFCIHPRCTGLYSSVMCGGLTRVGEGWWWCYSMCMYNNMYYFTPFCIHPRCTELYTAVRYVEAWRGLVRAGEGCRAADWIRSDCWLQQAYQLRSSSDERQGQKEKRGNN
jgi:hypothetical protein